MQKKLITLVLLGASVALLAGCVSNKAAPTDITVQPPVVEVVPVPVPEATTPEVAPAPEAPALPEAPAAQ